MAATINIHQAKTHLSRILERVHAGEEIILAKFGKPYARLVPFREESIARRPGRLLGRVTDDFFDPLPDNELNALEGNP